MLVLDTMMDTRYLPKLLSNWNGSTTMDDNDIKLAICTKLQKML